MPTPFPPPIYEIGDWVLVPGAPKPQRVADRMWHYEGAWAYVIAGRAFFAGQLRRVDDK